MTEYVLGDRLENDYSNVQPSLPPVEIGTADVFPGSIDGPYLKITSWTHPVLYFVGRNGSGKSRTAKSLAQKLGARLLSTDRLVGIMAFENYGWGATPAKFKGVPLSFEDNQLDHMQKLVREAGTASEELRVLREQPDVALRVAAFLQRALGRSVELRESAGFLDPYIRVGNSEYSLLRDEGHGLRELVVLLTAVYRDDYQLTVVDEPELHLHPSLARLWISELVSECRRSGRRAVVVTHDPGLVRPKDHEELGALWYFRAGSNPSRFTDYISHRHEHRVTASLASNPTLVSDLVFSPRSVLVEGVTDVAALAAAAARTKEPAIVTQTDYVECGGVTEVALWFGIAKALGLDARAVVDLDALFTPNVQETMTRLEEVQSVLVSVLSVAPATVGEAVKPLTQEAGKSAYAKNPKGRAEWLVSLRADVSASHISRAKTLISAWREAGMWVHEKGSLEAVLNIGVKGVVEARAAAMTAGPIDDVVDWCSYTLDPSGELKNLLNVAVERIAHTIMEALRSTPDGQFDRPLGSSRDSDQRIVTVEPVGPGQHRITVKLPLEFEGYWVEFTRQTTSEHLDLIAPT